MARRIKQKRRTAYEIEVDRILLRHLDSAFNEIQRRFKVENIYHTIVRSTRDADNLIRYADKLKDIIVNGLLKV